MYWMIAAAVLPMYAFSNSGTYSYNSQFQTHIFNRADGSSFCALTTAPGSTSSGIDYRFAISFGDRNEIRLATDTALPKLRSISISFNDGSEFEFLDLKQGKVAGTPIAYVEMSRSMMTKVLTALKTGGGHVSLGLPHGTPSFELPANEREEAYEGVKACEASRLGKVVPD